MVLKMRTLFFSKTGNAQILSERVSRENKCTSDQIPPAYPCENEKVLFLFLELDGSVPPQLQNFLKTLTTQRTKNVAFCILSKTGARGIADLKDCLSGTGVNAIDKVLEFQMKGGLFKKASLTEQDADTATKWAAGIIQSLMD